MKKILGIFLLVFGLALAGFVLYKNSRYVDVTRTFSNYTILSSSWEKYKVKFLNQDGRIIDYSQGDVTTSEGQSYAMLRSVWSNDKETFDKVWRFTRENLKRPNDNLFGWRWGKKEDANYGFLSNGGENNAADADSDIAYALILASRRWDNQEYLVSAKEILADIWQFNVATAGGKWYLTAGNWAEDSTRLIVNPSYFAPYEWRLFAEVDSERGWQSLITPAFELLKKSGELALDKEKSVGLPPDWIAIDKKSGEVSATNLDKLTTDYSYDATRVVFRIGLDYELNKDQQALDYLSSLKFLEETYLREGRLVASYSHDGNAGTDIESPLMYATALGYFIHRNPDLAKKIYDEKIIKLYSNAENSFDDRLSYYDQNWLWFGTALYNRQLRNY